MSLADAQKLVSGVVKVASLPEIYMKIEAALDSPKSSSKYLAEILQEDTALTARILRLANSSFFNYPSKIDTVTQAVTVIGTRQLRDIVLASSVVGIFKDIPEELVDMDDFWRHSISCGVTSRVISTIRRENNVETAFVSGLLHDIGRLILYKEKPEQMSALIQESRETNQLLYLGERETFGFDHAILGGLLLKEWKLPTKLIETTLCHHVPSKAKEFVAEAANIHVANILANALQTGSTGEVLVPPLAPAAWDLLGVPPENLELILAETEKQYAVAVEFVLGGE